MNPSARVVLAVITRPHGLLGAVRAKVFNPDTEALIAGAKLRLTLPDRSERNVRVQKVTSGATTWVLQLQGVSDPNAAEQLRDGELWLPRSELPPPAEGEHYHVDLVGCLVLDPAGNTLGTVREVLSYPTVDALRVEGPNGELEVPMVPMIVQSIDTQSQRIVIDATAMQSD